MGPKGREFFNIFSMTAVSDLSILNTRRGFEILSPYQAIFNGFQGEDWEPALSKTLLVIFVYDVQFPRGDLGRIRELLDLMPLKLALDGGVLEKILEAREDPTYEKLREVLLAMDVRDIFALGW
jgi:hypothetical protein